MKPFHSPNITQVPNNTIQETSVKQRKICHGRSSLKEEVSQIICPSWVSCSTKRFSKKNVCTALLNPNKSVPSHVNVNDYTNKSKRNFQSNRGTSQPSSRRLKCQKFSFPATMTYLTDWLICQCIFADLVCTDMNLWYIRWLKKVTSYYHNDYTHLFLLATMSQSSSTTHTSPCDYESIFFNYTHLCLRLWVSSSARQDQRTFINDHKTNVSVFADQQISSNKFVQRLANAGDFNVNTIRGQANENKQTALGVSILSLNVNKVSPRHETHFNRKLKKRFREIFSEWRFELGMGKTSSLTWL